MRRVIATLALSVCLPPAASAWFDLRDADGRRHTLADARGRQAVVLLFLASECPLSNQYLPDLRRLSQTYSTRGVDFYAVHSDPSEGPEAVRRHAREYGYAFPALLDPGQSVARRLGATTTPEAAVLSAEGELLYLGRIDDRAPELGRRRLTPSRHDLRLALDRTLAGRRLPPPFPRPAGCPIPFARVPAAGPYTFSRDIAPILYRHCAECHRPGDVGPFPLLGYQDAAKRASLIASLAASRTMPPWKPEPGFGRFYGERGLTQAEIEVLGRWAQDGAPEGDPRQLPPPPSFPDGWSLGVPDLTASMPEPFAAPAGGPDLYQCFVVRPGLDRDRWVRAIEFRPENRRLLHHALLFADPAGIGRQKDAATPEPGYPCFGSPGFLPARGLGGWTPGTRVITLPEGAALTLPKAADLVLQLHFHPTGKTEREQSTVGLYFTDRPPQRRLLDIPLGSRNIDIPPGEKAYQVRDRFTLPVDVQAIGVIPHAHYLCQDMKGFAVLPGGEKIWLLWIRDWDFNWQEQYRFQTPLGLPAGTRLEMEFTYDNTAENPRNPNRPPRRVLWGPETTDEMAGLHVQVIPERMSDLPELTQALWGKLMRSAGGGFFR